MHGHYWTFWPFIGSLVSPPQPPPARHFRTIVEDPRRGRVRLTGRLSERQGDALLVIVHGLGGSDRSYYAIRAAQAAHQAGLSHLRLCLRGADRSGADVYHAALTDDLRATLSSPALRRFRRIYLLGYSLGGHLLLRYGAEHPDRRVVSVAAVCAPTDLAAGAREIDKPKGRLYRHNLLRGLKDIYAHAASGGGMPLTIEEAQRIHTIRDWDERIVAPRFGFRNAEDYWARASAGPHLGRIARPTLAVVADEDPMVFAHTVRPSLRRAANIRSVFVARGGHVGFPSDVDLGLGSGPQRLEAQLLDWLQHPH